MEAQATDYSGMNMPGMDHSSQPAHVHASSEPAQANASSTFSARAKVNLPTAGAWRAVVAIRETGHAPESAEAVVAADYAGPYPLYLAGTGTLMGATILYGIIQKRRLPTTGRR